MAQTPAELQKQLTGLEPDEFEEYIGGIFSQLGYSTKLTQQARDKGVDVILEEGSLTVGIQVKKYSEGTKVSGPEIQQYAGVKEQNNFDVFSVITSSSFTRPAIENAKKLDVYTIDISQLHTIISENIDPFREVQKIESPSKTFSLPQASAGESYNFSGSKKEVTEEVHLREGLTYVEFDGSSKRGGEEVELVESDSSPISGSHSKLMTVIKPTQTGGQHSGVFYSPGGHYAFRVSAYDEWNIQIHQPSISSSEISNPEGKYSGTGNEFLGPFQFEGKYKTILTDAESAPVYVQLHIGNGKRVDFGEDDWGLIEVHPYDAMSQYDMYDRIYEFQGIGFLSIQADRWEISTERIS